MSSCPRLAAGVVAALAVAGSAFGQGADLLSETHGAAIVQRTTEAPGRPAVNLLDEHGAATPWAAPESTLPQTVIFRLDRNRRFDTVVIDPAGDAELRNWAKVVEIATADPFPHMGGWEHVATVELTPAAGPQTFTFDAVSGRFVRVIVSAVQGPDATRVSLGDIALYGR